MDSKEKGIVIPRLLEQSFLNIGRTNMSPNGIQQETLAFLVGHETQGDFVAKELIFPVQAGTSGKVDDLGMCGRDTMEWMLETSETAKEYGSSFRILAWIHSHVEGALCGLSSVDVHTQHAYNIIFPYKVYAIVFEVRRDGSYCMDCFDLTHGGKAAVASCCRKNNLSHVQHDSCSLASYYTSHKDLITVQDLPLKVTDGRFTSPFNGTSKNDSKGLVIQDMKPDVSQYSACQACQKPVQDLKGLIAHVARAKKCKSVYGEKYEKLKQQQTKQRKQESYMKAKATICERKRNKYERLADDEKEFLRVKRKAYNDSQGDAIKKRQRLYNEKHAKVIVAKQASYDREHASEVAAKQARYNKSHREEIAARQAIYDKKHASKVTARQAQYNKLHAETIATKQAIYNKKNASKVAANQAQYNKKHSREIAAKQAIYNRRHSKVVSEKQAQYNKCHVKEIADKQAIYNKSHAASIAKKARDSRLVLKTPLKDFFKATSTGPVYPCICCHRLMFLSGVVKVNPDVLKNEIGTLLYKSSIKYSKEFLINGETYLCQNCKLQLKKGQRPVISACNGLLLDSVPAELKLTELEQQLIAKRILFMKIFKLPRSRMPAIKDRVINVPLEDEDISKTIETLPRDIGTAGLINVQLKRMKKLKNCHLEAYIRPDALRAALQKLKSLGNLHYQNVKVSFGGDTESSAIDTLDMDDDTPDDSGESDDNDDNPHNNATCLVRENPEILVAVNSGTRTVEKKCQQSSKPLEIAPGEGKIPTNWLRESDFDVKAFPIHFPSGRFGLDYCNREDKVSKQKYFIQRLLNKDGRFRQDCAYLFAAQQRVEREALEQQFDIVVQKGQVRKGQSGEDILSSTDSFAAFQKVPGTPKYWQTARNELVAKVSQLGPFQLFFTLSCGEMRWPEITAALLQLEGHEVTIQSDEGTATPEFRVSGKPLDEYLSIHQVNSSELLRKNILIVTRMFDNRVKKFIRHIVMSPKGPFQVEYYNYRVEFQMRGMAHIHGVMWMSRQSLSKFIAPNTHEYISQMLPELIDTMISCERPVQDETLCKVIDEVQTHHHSKSCRKYGDYCRFYFPRLPSDETIVAKPLSNDLSDKEKKEKMKKLKAVLQKVRNILESDNLNEGMTLDELLQQAEVSYSSYKEALRTSERGSSIVLKRTVRERNINNYNPVFLKAWNANIDVQFCLDHYAVITYICDYYGKDESGMTELLQETLRSSKGQNQNEQLRCLKMAYMTHRQIGACEAVYRLLPSLHMKDSNVTCNFVSTGFPENRSVFMKRVCENEEGKDEEDSGEDDEGIRETNNRYEKSISVHDRYSKRPPALEHMNLAEFATSYRVVRRRQKKLTFIANSSVEKAEISWISFTSEYPIQITFDSEKLGVMQLRSFPCILRIHESKKKREEHEYYYAELLLFCPWRDEVSDLHRDSPEMCYQKYETNFKLVCSKRKQMFPFTDSFEEARQHLKDGSIDQLRSSHIGDLLDGEGHQQHSDDEEDDMPLAISVMHPGDIQDPSNHQSLKEDNLPAKYKLIDIENMDELYCIAQQLIPEQQEVFNTVMAFCQKMALSWETDCAPPDPIRIILHGGAGSGKSNVIRAVSKWSEKILRKAGDHPQRPRVLLTAPTGMAASIIGGTTLHSAFNFNYGDDLKPLSDKKIDEMRCSLADLKLLILDEMSMVRSDMLYQLHIRLCDILQSNELFGGISILLVGDLLQLKPVKGSYIFQEPRCEKYKPYHNVTPLWDEFDVYILKHNHRQGQGNEWAKTLNRLRIGDTSHDEEILMARIISDAEAKEKINACHIFYTNKEVDEHNSLMLNKISGTPTAIPAIVSLPHGCKSSDQFGRVDRTTFMRVLQLKKNARIMLIHNVDVVDGLCNGAIGTVIDIIVTGSDQVQCVIIEFDNDDIGVSQRMRHVTLSESYKPRTATPIFRAEFQYQLPRGKSGAQHSATAKLLQFPLRLSWAVTAHKVQGQTFKRGSHIVVHWHSRLTEGMAYVMLGRCQDSNDISITGPFNLKSIKCNESAREMTDTLRKRAGQVLQGWKISGSFKISLINTRGFRKHEKDIQNDFLLQQADIICITETWLQLEHEKNIALTSHAMIALASKGRGKGCAIMSKSALTSKSLIHDDVQILSTAVQDMQIILVYRSSQQDLRELTEALRCVMKPSLPVILLGDFNISPGKNKPWDTFISRCNLQQTITFPTHNKGGILDHVYVSEVLVTQVSIFPHYVYFSDHVCINIEINMCDKV